MGNNLITQVIPATSKGYIFSAFSGKIAFSSLRRLSLPASFFFHNCEFLRKVCSENGVFARPNGVFTQPNGIFFNALVQDVHQPAEILESLTLQDVAGTWMISCHLYIYIYNFNYIILYSLEKT